MNQKFLSDNLAVLQYAGLWNPYDAGTFKYKINKVYSYFVYFLIFKHILTQFGNVIMSTHDLELMMDGVSLSLTYLSMFLKLIPLVWRYEKLKVVALKLNLGGLHHDIRNSSEFEKVLVTYRNRGRKIYRFYYLMGIIVMGVLFISWFKNIAGFASSVDEGNTTYVWKPELLFVAKFPCDLNDSFCYFFAMVVQWCAATNGPTLNIGMDALVAAMMFQMSGHFRIVKLMLKDMDEKIIQSLNAIGPASPKQKKDVIDSLNSNLGETSIRVKHIEAIHLHSCIRYHQTVLNLADDINRVISPVLFMQFLLGSGTISLTIFQLIHISNKAEFYIQFLLVLLCQLMIYCWVGEEIQQESKEVAGTVFETEWYKHATETQKSAVVMMNRAQKPVAINGAGIFKVNLETFTTILSSSYSLYTVVSKMKE